MASPEIARVVYFGSKHTPAWFIEHFNKLPQVKEGEVLVKVRLATICPVDLEVFSGKNSNHIPLVLGHEAICEVVEDKRRQENNEHDKTNKLIDEPGPLEKGTRVIFGINVPCSKCERCRIGVTQSCENNICYGQSTLSQATGFSGCYATHIVLREGSHILPVPDSISDRTAAPANCALATVVHAVDEARTSGTNQVAVVQGAGLLGLYACALLRHKGYKKVICCDVQHERVKMAERFGGVPCTTSLLEENSEFADCVIEVCGNSSVIAEGLSALRYGGMYIWAGMNFDSSFNMNGEYVIKKCITIKGIHTYQPHHLEAALKFLIDTKDKLPYEELVSLKSYDLQNIEQAIHLAKSHAFHRVALKP